MAMDPTTEANLIIDNLTAYWPRMGEPAFRPQILLYWTAVCSGEISHKIDHLDVLPMAHFGPNLNNPIGQTLTVPAAGIFDGSTLPCTGTANTGTTSAPKDIEGKGRVA